MLIYPVNSFGIHRDSQGGEFIQIKRAVITSINKAATKNTEEILY